MVIAHHQRVSPIIICMSVPGCHSITLLLWIGILVAGMWWSGGVSDRGGWSAGKSGRLDGDEHRAYEAP